MPVMAASREEAAGEIVKLYDCSAKLGHLTAAVEQSVKHTELKGPFKEFLKALELN